MPEKECPTRTVGPSCRASTRWAEAAASGSVVSGFCTAVALSPAACNRAITSDQHDPSANKPCTKTMLRAFVGAGDAAMPRVEMSEAAAPAMRAAENLRLFMVMLRFPSRVGSLVNGKPQRSCTSNSGSLIFEHRPWFSRFGSFDRGHQPGLRVLRLKERHGNVEHRLVGRVYTTDRPGTKQCFVSG